MTKTKVFDHSDEHFRCFIALSAFLALGTADASYADLVNGYARRSRRRVH
jgi:predicted pyridoxine 5'-phosphate oxidase superfamily flavin-nucleotide-binding protein